MTTRSWIRRLFARMPRKAATRCPLAVEALEDRLAPAIAGSPANDGFAAAAVLSGTSATATGSNVNATGEPGEPDLFNDVQINSVWWEWRCSWWAPGFWAWRSGRS